MTAVIESVDIKGITLKKGTSVEIDIWQDGRGMEVTILGITMENGEITIESVTNYGSIIHHSVEQWEDMLVRKL